MHKDIKILNLSVDKDGILKIMDCGLASFFDLEHKDPMSRIVVMYLAATYNDVGIDLLSAWCILAELLARKAITEGCCHYHHYHMHSTAQHQLCTQGPCLAVQ